MAVVHRRSWKIAVHAKIGKLYIKFKATVKRPSGKFQRLDKLLIGVNSDSESRILVQQRRSLKSRILGFVKKHFGRRRSKKAFGFRMPDVPYPYPHLVAEAENQTWHLGRAELSCVAALGVGLGYLLAELSPILNASVPATASFYGCTDVM